MKVYILTGEPFPNGMAATNRIKCYARAIKEGGMECEVVVFRRTEVYGKKPENTVGNGQYSGISYRYIGGTPLRGCNALIRQIDDRLDFWRTKRYLKQNLKKGDVLLLYMGMAVEQALVSMRVAHQQGAYCVRDLCEIPYGTGKETPKSVHMRQFTYEKQFPLLDGIISISDNLMNLAKTYTSSSCKHIKVPILVDYEYYKMADRSAETDIPFIFHAGTLYEQKDGIQGMLEAFGKAIQGTKRTIRFVSTGSINRANVNEKEQIERIIAKYHIEDKVVFTGYINNTELKDYLSRATMVIINKYRTQQNLYCFSTKLGEYLAAAKPVVITNVGEAINWLKDGESAYITEPENTDALADAIVHVFNNPEEGRTIGKKGQEVCCRCFDYRVWSKPLVDFLRGLGN